MIVSQIALCDLTRKNRVCLRASKVNLQTRSRIMRGSCHIRNVLIGVEYQNCCRTLDVYLLANSIKTHLPICNWPLCKLQVCNLFLINLLSRIEKSKYTSKFHADFNIQRQLEHFEYDMNRTLGTIFFVKSQGFQEQWSIDDMH